MCTESDGIRLEKRRRVIKTILFDNYKWQISKFIKGVRRFKRTVYRNLHRPVFQAEKRFVKTHIDFEGICSFMDIS